MDLLEIMQKRRSVRSYTGEPIPEEALMKIIQAGLLSPTGRNLQPWEFTVVKDKEMLHKLSACRPAGSGILKGAAAAIVVIGDTTVTDVWTEDCSIAMTMMHLMASSLGIGSCWVQGRLRPSPDGRFAEDIVRELLKIPETKALEAILCLGMPSDHPKPKVLQDLPMEKVYYEQYQK